MTDELHTEAVEGTLGEIANLTRRLRTQSKSRKLNVEALYSIATQMRQLVNIPMLTQQVKDSNK